MAIKSKMEPEKPGAITGAPGKPAARPKRASGKGGRKPRATTSAAQTAVNNPASSATTFEPSDEQIRGRAYFIAERRMQLSLPGDSADDWLEAKRQLLEEAGRAQS